MMQLIIPYPKTKAGRASWSKQFGLNAIYAGKHWSRRKQDSEYWHMIVSGELRKQGMFKTAIYYIQLMSRSANNKKHCE